MYDFSKIYELNQENEWFKPKHVKMYRDFSFLAASESPAIRRKVGAVILSPRGGLFIGYNGTPPGEDNVCEDDSFVTMPHVIHAEANAIDKMLSEDVDPTGSIIFLTDSPCLNCTNNVILKYKIKAVFYSRRYHDLTPLDRLESKGVLVQYIDEDYIEYLRRDILLNRT